MPTKQKNNLSNADRWRREAQIIGKLIVRAFTSLRVGEYGARHLGAALEKILIVAAVRACEADDLPCTASQIAKMLKMPLTNVQRALAQLSAIKTLRKVGRSYVNVPERIDDGQIMAFRDEVIAAGRKLETLSPKAS